VLLSINPELKDHLGLLINRLKRRKLPSSRVIAQQIEEEKSALETG
jgi:uncharacterized membrane-anchored protein YhcB (DUF1043 family)